MKYDVIRYRHNIMNINSWKTFSSLKGGFNMNCRDVYFVRSIGVSPDFINDIQEMDSSFCDAMKEGHLLYKRIESLPLLSRIEDTDFYLACFAKWMDSDKGRMETRCSVIDERLVLTLGTACQRVLEEYRKGKGSLSESMGKNFIVKLMYWFDYVMKDFLISWDERISIKIVADNVSKEQEYLFYYMLTLIGSDVLLIQSKEDLKGKIDLLNLSKELVLGDFGECVLPSINVQKQQQKVSTQNAEVKIERVIEKTQEERQEKSFEELAQLASSVVMIAIHNEKGEVVGTGSGIMVGKKGYILTNNHVVSGGRFYSVRIEDDETIYKTDELIKYNTLLDLAILRIDRDLVPIPIYKKKKKLVRGQKVVAIGSPLGLFNSVSDGIISGFRTMEGVDMMQFTAPTSHGSSGGAVINMYGEVVGISTAGINDGQNINLAVGYESINAFIKGFE